jgi:phenylalanyl-tRNA synthetase beta chain
MLNVIKTNINHGNKTLRLFEIGRRYLKGQGTDLPIEEKVLNLALTGEAYNNWHDHTRNVTFHDLKGIIANLLRFLSVPDQTMVPISAPLMSDGFQIFCDKTCIGCIGIFKTQVLDYFDIKQDVFYAEINIGTLCIMQDHETRFIEYSKYPPSFRDLSIVVSDEIKVSDIMQLIKEQNTDLISNVELFDHYTGKQIEKGRRSLSFAIEYQSAERTLSHEEVDAIHTTIVNALSNTFSAVLR